MTGELMCNAPLRRTLWHNGRLILGIERRWYQLVLGRYVPDLEYLNLVDMKVDFLFVKSRLSTLSLSRFHHYSDRRAFEIRVFFSV